MTTIADAAKGKVTLIAGINSLSTNHSIELAHQANNLGYDGLMLSANPYSYQTKTVLLRILKPSLMPLTYLSLCTIFQHASV
ncbi:dihydrodipicolinate synthase [Psychrobacter sp. JCM 18900]|nr:dihydrodipicolinate synthase [Psychrobacter sp. JCM 18900]